MRAASYDDFGGPVTVRDLPEPRIGAEDALIGVKAAGGCRSDRHGWIGHHADIKSLLHVPGHEFSGTVAAVGERVTRWAGGELDQRVQVERSKITAFDLDPILV